MHPGKLALEDNLGQINEILANLTAKERKGLQMFISKSELESIAKYVDDARNLAIEEAACAAEDAMDQWINGPLRMRGLLETIAAIRALKT